MREKTTAMNHNPQTSRRPRSTVTLPEYRLLAFVLLFLCSLPLYANPINVLMVLWRGETAAEQGFVQRLAALPIDVNIRQIDAGQDRNHLSQQLRSIAPELNKFDYLYSFGTTASRMSQTINQGRIPQIFSMVSDPQGAGLAPDPNIPTKRLTGSTDAISAALRVTLAQQLFPIRRIAILVNARETNTIAQLGELERLCANEGITLQILRVAPNTHTLDVLLQRLKQGEIDADTLYLPSDSYIISQSAAIMAALAETPYRVIGATRAFVEDGALLAIAPNYTLMGAQLADRLLAIEQGAPIHQLPLVRVDRPLVLYNEATRKRLAISIPHTLSHVLERVD